MLTNMVGHRLPVDAQFSGDACKWPALLTQGQDRLDLRHLELVRHRKTPGDGIVARKPTFRIFDSSKCRFSSASRLSILSAARHPIAIARKISLEQVFRRVGLEWFSFLPFHRRLLHSYRRLPSRLIWPAPLTT